MSVRFDTFYKELPPCNTFADVGCDHAKLAKMMLESGKCKFAVCSDISEKCIEKANKLLYEFIISDKAKTVVCDGFSEIKEHIDVAVIAGMGGEEIIKILSQANTLPDKILLSPQKNTAEVRKYLQNYYEILKDYVFFDKKYYDLIFAVKGKSNYSEEQIEFGKDNLINKGTAFIERLRKEKSLAENALKLALNPSEKEKLTKKINTLRELLDENHEYY